MGLFRPKAKAHPLVTGRGPKPLKIVIGGPFAAGKTTLIKTVSEVTVVGTERTITDETSAIKQQTTVAMDFGRISFGPDCSLHLFGAPGQRRFEVMWEILSEGMIGFILLVRATEHRSVEEAVQILQMFRSYADVPYVVGVTHLDKVDRPAHEVLGEVRSTLQCPPEVEVHACDPRDREHVKSLLLVVLNEVLNRLERQPALG